MGTTTETVHITPSPRILKVLAEIEFAPWQCLAELVDNAFDEFLEMELAGLSGEDRRRVTVTLPTTASGTVVVVDNGRGMRLEQVTNAVKAGYSSNDPLSKLGLFGMGFNVATVRLGEITTFLSTRAGDSEWVGVQIDVANMADDFAVPVVRVSKDDPAEHGTRIEIERLGQSGRHFTRGPNRTRVRNQLGGVYAHLLAARGYELIVDGIEVKPWRHCVWGESRKVVRRGIEVPAVIKIDEPLTAHPVCTICGSWQEPDAPRCAECGSADLAERERRIHGWLGIARELDSKEYGIDFLRNGRKIMRFDKSLFTWADPDDPTGASAVEYPIEVPANMGRIVGEIHLDHVPVRYTKDSFDTADRSWRYAVRVLRGETSLQPRRAAQAGDEPNESPLAKLFTGYRRNNPGTDYLTAGDGSTRRDTSEWVRLFHEGDPDYQDDTKWWDAAVEHDRLAPQIKAERERQRRRTQHGGRATEEDPTLEFLPTATDGQPAPGGGDGTPATPTAPPGSQPTPVAPQPAPPPAPPPPLTFAERLERWTTVGRPMLELKAEYIARGVPGQPVPLEAYAVSGEEVISEEGDSTPVLMVGRPRGAFFAIVDLDHALFQSFDDDPADLVLMALAQQMLVRRNATVPIAAVFAELKDRYLAARAIDSARLQPEANQLLSDVQRRMVECVGEDPARPWNRALADYERGATAERIATVLRTDDTEAVIASGQYLPIMPPSAVPRVVREWPQAFFDGRLFSAPYVRLDAAPAEAILARVTGYLNDVAWLAGSPSDPSREELARARLSLQLLPDELAEPR
jgi:hypothetical protein